MDDPLLKYFTFDHLRDAHLRLVSAHFRQHAVTMCELLPRTPERTVMLRKLLESKDAAVRAALDATTATPDGPDSPAQGWGDTPEPPR